MNASGFAVTAIIAFALALWAFIVARDPKSWRLWWMDIFGILDVDTTRDVRRVQENQLRFMSLLMSFLLLLTCVSCSFWTFDALREQVRDKSPFERDQEFLRRHIEKKSRK
jgi:hypothetical protein